VRTAVDVEQHRVALRLVEVGGTHDPGVDLVGAVGGAGGEAFPPEQSCREFVADVGAALVADVELGGVGCGFLRPGHEAGRRIERRHRDRALGDRCGDERTVGREPVQVRGATILGGCEQMVSDSQTGARPPTVGRNVRSSPAEIHRMSPCGWSSPSIGRIPTLAFCGKMLGSAEPMNATSDPSGDTDGWPY
jgi:hypothetical protein